MYNFFMERSNLTKNALADGLKELLNEKQLSKITIRELTEKCDVNRQTFYYHFADIRDLCRWMVFRDINSIIEFLFDNPSSYADVVLAFLQYEKSQGNVLLNILDGGQDPSALYAFYNIHEEVFRDLLNTVFSRSGVDNEFKLFTANLYAAAAAGMEILWIRGGMKESPEKMTELLTTYLADNTKTAFERREAALRQNLTRTEAHKNTGF